jgi:hypothetical protein
MFPNVYYLVRDARVYDRNRRILRYQASGPLRNRYAGIERDRYFIPG